MLFSLFTSKEPKPVEPAPDLTHDRAMRNVAGTQPISSRGMQIGVEHLLVPQVNRVLRHCRIGKIILK